MQKLEGQKPKGQQPKAQKTKQKKVAIIGSGIAGLSCAFHLHRDYKVTVFEKNDYLGGHTDTHTFDIDGEATNIDSGFIIFSPEHYPNFCQMIDKLGIASKKTDMSFSVVNEQTGLEYNPTNLNKLFCQRSNIVNPSFYRMLFDILRFYQCAPAILKHNDDTQTVKQYLLQHNYSNHFVQNHLFPMVSALWSATPERVEQYPIRYLVEFMQNHGLLKILNRAKWRVIQNGSFQYINAIKQLANCDFRINCKVMNIVRNKEKVTIHSANNTPEEFDAVFITAHSNQAAVLLNEPSKAERSILHAIPFQKNNVVIHTDESIMSHNKNSWASWNTRVPKTEQTICTATYWMNSLQALDKQSNIFVSLNPYQKIDKNKILKTRIYHHPVYTPQSVAARKRLHEINNQQRTFYAGAFWGWGFHEDGARTAAQAVELFKQSKWA